MSDAQPPRPPEPSEPPESPEPAPPGFPVRITDLLLILIVSLGGMRVVTAILAAVVLGDSLAAGGEALKDAGGRLLAFTVVMAVVQTVVLLGAVYLFVIRKHGLRWADLGLRPAVPPWYSRAALFAVLLVPAVALINALLGRITGAPFENPQIYAIAPGGFSWTGLVLMLVVVGIVAPFAEEVAFRGVLFTWLRDRFGVTLGVLVSSLFFSLLHGLPQLIPALFVVGAVLAVLYHRSGSLWTAILAHGLFNALMVLALYTALAAEVRIP